MNKRIIILILCTLGSLVLISLYTTNNKVTQLGASGESNNGQSSSNYLESSNNPSKDLSQSLNARKNKDLPPDGPNKLVNETVDRSIAIHNKQSSKPLKPVFVEKEQ